VAYGCMLGLPLFLDDRVHFRRLEGRSLGGVWTSTKIIGYYPPRLSGSSGPCAGCSGAISRWSCIW